MPRLCYNQHDADAVAPRKQGRQLHAAWLMDMDVSTATTGLVTPVDSYAAAQGLLQEWGCLQLGEKRMEACRAAGTSAPLKLASEWARRRATQSSSL